MPGVMDKVTKDLLNLKRVDLVEEIGQCQFSGIPTGLIPTSSVFTVKVPWAAAHLTA